MPSFALCYTPEGTPYYYDSLTGASRWATSEDWQLRYDPSGAAIYFNRVTGESQWAEAPQQDVLLPEHQPHGHARSHSSDEVRLSRALGGALHAGAARPLSGPSDGRSNAAAASAHRRSASFTARRVIDTTSGDDAPPPSQGARAERRRRAERAMHASRRTGSNSGGGGGSAHHRWRAPHADDDGHAGEDDWLEDSDAQPLRRGGGVAATARDGQHSGGGARHATGATRRAAAAATTTSTSSRSPWRSHATAGAGDGGDSSSDSDCSAAHHAQGAADSDGYDDVDGDDDDRPAEVSLLAEAAQLLLAGLASPFLAGGARSAAGSSPRFARGNKRRDGRGSRRAAASATASPPLTISRALAPCDAGGQARPSLSSAASVVRTGACGGGGSLRVASSSSPTASSPPLGSRRDVEASGGSARRAPSDVAAVEGGDDDDGGRVRRVREEGEGEEQAGEGLARAAAFVGMTLEQRTDWLRRVLLRYGGALVTAAQVAALFLSTSSLPVLAGFLCAAARSTSEALCVVERVVRTAAIRLSPRSDLPLPVLARQARVAAAAASSASHQRRSAFPLEYLAEPAAAEAGVAHAYQPPGAAAPRELPVAAFTAAGGGGAATGDDAAPLRRSPSGGSGYGVRTAAAAAPAGFDASSGGGELESVCGVEGATTYAQLPLPLAHAVVPREAAPAPWQRWGLSPPLAGPASAHAPMLSLNGVDKCDAGVLQPGGVVAGLGAGARAMGSSSSSLGAPAATATASAVAGLQRALHAHQHQHQHQQLQPFVSPCGSCASPAGSVASICSSSRAEGCGADEGAEGLSAALFHPDLVSELLRPPATAARAPQQPAGAATAGGSGASSAHGSGGLPLSSSSRAAAVGALPSGWPSTSPFVAAPFVAARAASEPSPGAFASAADGFGATLPLDAAALFSSGHCGAPAGGGPGLLLLLPPGDAAADGGLICSCGGDGGSDDDDALSCSTPFAALRGADDDECCPRAGLSSSDVEL